MNFTWTRRHSFMHVCLFKKKKKFANTRLSYPDSNQTYVSLLSGSFTNTTRNKHVSFVKRNLQLHTGYGEWGVTSHSHSLLRLHFKRSTCSLSRYYTYHTFARPDWSCSSAGKKDSADTVAIYFSTTVLQASDQTTNSVITNARGWNWKFPFPQF